MHCPFCERLGSGECIASAALAVAFADAFPVAEGHVLVVPRRHEADYFALSAVEQAEMWTVLAEVQRSLAAKLAPDGWNVGLNVGCAAGQTIAHAHLHLIPRRAGDVADPRGGVRWVIPARARYW